MIQLVVANEHIDHSTVTFSAGNGLTGGGTIVANRTFAVGQGTGITVNANDIAIGQWLKQTLMFNSTMLR